MVIAHGIIRGLIWIFEFWSNYIADIGCFQEKHSITAV